MHDYMSQSLLRLFELAFNKNYPRLNERLKEIIVKQLNDVKEKLLEHVLEILDMERRVFTLNHYYMDTVNKIKEKNKKENNADNQPSIAASASVNFSKVAVLPNLKTSTTSSTIAYASVSNEAQAAMDIQIALHSYSKVVEKRMTDSITQACYYKFITKCALKIDQLLSTSIPSSQLLQYMREPHKQTVLRNKLTHSIQAYEEALQLGQTYM
ncbi:hypothetical protein I4U23_003681 [Adineta vaga]|nr:hypothetical protein I4U23_003681 [Adineta vaga]